jgi:UDP-N-acetylmuramate dehydrogenase
MIQQLKDLSYYRTGGSCAKLYLPTTILEAKLAMEEIAQSRIPFFVLGGGTNSLVWDDHYPGAVISFARMQSVTVAGNVLTCEGGAENTKIAEVALAAGLAGAAWMYFLPGQIGGTTRMNARCYGGEISQICTKVTAISKDGQISEYTDPKVFRGYKSTLFMENGDIIASVELQLRQGDRAGIDAEMQRCRRDREAKDQFIYPSCGCVFKNDYTVGVPSGMLLDRAGVRGMHVGGAEVSPKHCNFVYNKGASSREILALTFAMREKVWEKFGVWLEYEMEILGRLPKELFEQVSRREISAPRDGVIQPLRDAFSGKGSQRT